MGSLLRCLADQSIYVCAAYRKKERVRSICDMDCKDLIIYDFAELCNLVPQKGF